MMLTIQWDFVKFLDSKMARDLEEPTDYTDLGGH